MQPLLFNPDVDAILPRRILALLPKIKPVLHLKLIHKLKHTKTDSTILKNWAYEIAYRWFREQTLEELASVEQYDCEILEYLWTTAYEDMLKHVPWNKQ